MKKESIDLLSNIYKTFADPTRLRIIMELLNREISVNNLCKKLNMSQSAISHQLQLLRANNIVVTNRIGKIINYKIVNNKIKQLLESNMEIYGMVNDESVL